jgi:hypothetical protein
MKRTILHSFRYCTMALVMVFGLTATAFAQEEGTEQAPEETPKDRPVRPAFESGLIFDASTTTLQPSKTLEMVIQHRFGTIENGIHDFFGVWAPSNIRLGMNYSILDNLTVGIGATKFNKMEDVQLKYRFLQQTRSNSIPVTVVLYESIGIDGSADSKWQDGYKFNNRFSYFTQLIISRRFDDHLSLQIAPGFTHYNSVDSVYNHDRLSISFAGRYKFTPQGSFIIAGDIPWDAKWIRDYQKVDASKTVYDKPNLTVGFEVSTSTHAFHIYLGSAQGILPQEDIMWNKNDFFNKGILIGLNVTRLWNF